MDPDAVIDSVCAGFTRRGIGCDDEGLVSGTAQMLENPDH